jgi:TolB-like protein/Tfp pilus assembly protein PilF
MSPSFSTFFVEFKARNVRRTMTIYASSALTSVGVVKLFSEAYDLPAVLFPIVVTLLTCGLVSAFIFGWYHGKEGAQRVRKKEWLLHGLVIGIATVAVVRVSGTSPRLPGVGSGNSIAVLPFQNLSDNKEDEYFSDGITEDILTQLSKIGDLKVVSRTSVMKYKDTRKSIREIGRELDVANILEGSVRRAGGRVRIASQLINTLTDEHLWAETYDRDMKDIFSIQSDVAQRIASSLKAQLSSDELLRLKKPSTQNLDAYSYYLRGRDYYNRYTREDNERAIEMFTRAIAADSTYALAYAGLGDAYALRTVRYSLSKEWADSAVVISTKAIALDPDLADGYKALGLACEGKGRKRQALEYYYKAVKLNPNYAPVVANIGWINNELGNYDEALFWMKKSLSLNPGAAHRYAYVAMMYGSLGDDSSAIEWYGKALTRQPDLVNGGLVELAYVYLTEGGLDSARAQIGRAISLQPNEVRTLEAAGTVELFARNYGRARQYFEKSVALSSLEEGPGVPLAYTLIKLGKHANATSILDSTLASYAHSIDQGDENLSTFMYIAYIYSIRGDTTRSLQWLQRAVDMGYRDYRWTTVDPLMENTRPTAQFKAIMTSLKSQVDAMRTRARQRESQQTQQ